MSDPRSRSAFVPLLILLMPLLGFLAFAVAVPAVDCRSCARTGSIVVFTSQEGDIREGSVWFCRDCNPERKSTLLRMWFPREIEGKPLTFESGPDGVIAKPIRLRE